MRMKQGPKHTSWKLEVVMCVVGTPMACGGSSGSISTGEVS